eukprot:scaffold5440_cov88-Isochrysis_galbana.AAC.1
MGCARTVPATGRRPARRAASGSTRPLRAAPSAAAPPVPRRRSPDPRDAPRRVLVSKVLSSLLGKKEYRVLILGLDNAGAHRPPLRNRAAAIACQARAVRATAAAARSRCRQDNHPVQAANGRGGDDGAHDRIQRRDCAVQKPPLPGAAPTVPRRRPLAFRDMCWALAALARRKVCTQTRRGLPPPHDAFAFAGVGPRRPDVHPAVLALLLPEHQRNHLCGGLGGCGAPTGRGGENDWRAK